MVRFGHFGGFEEDEEKTGKKSRNEIMKELIAKSKSHKRERQMIKEQNMDLQEEVDADLDEIRGLLVPMHAPSTEGRMVVNADRLKMISGEIERPSEQPLPPKEEEDDYDRAVKELAFDKRARPSNRTKTEEELALEAKKELEELEAKRVRRMKGIVSDDDEPETTKKRKRDSRNSQADDLGDNDYTEHWQQTVEDEEEMPLTYKDGKLVNNKIFMKPAAGESDSEEYGSEEESDSDSGSGSGSEEESGDESSSDKESAEKTKSKVAKKEYDVEDLGGNVALDSDQGSESSGSDSDDSDDSRDSEQRMLEEMATDSESEAEVEKPAKKKKKIVQEASASLPFTFEFPNNYEEFMDLIKDQSTENQLTIVKRLRILYSVKLAKENKEKMNRLMVILLKHTMDLSNSGSMDLEVIKGFTEHVIELCRQSPHAFAAWCQSRILFLRDRLNKNLLSGKKKTSLFPSPGDLLLFKNLARIYSVSDLQHPVMTPVMLLLAQYLEQAPINVDLDVMSGLFICRIYYQVMLANIVR
jgi:nucleolar protein 14